MIAALDVRVWFSQESIVETSDGTVRQHWRSVSCGDAVQHGVRSLSRATAVLVQSDPTT